MGGDNAKPLNDNIFIASKGLLFLKKKKQKDFYPGLWRA